MVDVLQIKTYFIQGSGERNRTQVRGRQKKHHDTSNVAAAVGEMAYLRTKQHQTKSDL